MRALRGPRDVCGAECKQWSHSGRASRRALRPQAVASDVTTDDTAEARRRLARQFRRHKLEPGHAPDVAAVTPLSIQGLRPRPRQHASMPAEDPQQPRSSSSRSHVAPDPLLDAAVDAMGVAAAPASTAAAAARQLLERQFLLGLNSSPLSPYDDDGGPESSSNNSSTYVSDNQDDSRHSASQLPAQLLLPAQASAGKQLTKAIMQAKHWHQLQSLVQEHAPEFNTRHLCASITKLVQLQGSFSADPQATAVLQQLMSNLADETPFLEYRQACNMLWALSRLQQVAQPGRQLLAGLYRHAMAAGSSSSSSSRHTEGAAVAAGQQDEQQQGRLLPDMMHAAQLASSLVRLEQVLEPQQLQEVVAWLTSTSQELLQQVCQQYEQVPAQQQDHSSKSSSSHQHAHASACMESRDLATLVWALATLQVQPGPAWLSAFATAVACKGLVAPGGPRDLSMLLWATATFSKSAAEGSAAASALHTAAAAVVQAMRDADLHAWDAQNVSNTVWALATLGQRPPVPWLDQLLHRVEVLAGKHMNPQAVSNTLWALAALGVVPAASCKSALLSAATRQLQHFTPQGLSNSIWALAVLELTPPTAWQAGFWRVSRAALQQMNSQGLVNSLWAAARLGLQPPQEWVVDVAQLLLDKGVQSLSCQGLSNVLWAMARINCSCRQGPQLRHACLQQAVLRLESQQVASSANVADDAGSASVAAAAAAAYNGPFSVYECAALMYTVAQLRARESGSMQQQQQLSQALPAVAWPAGNSSSLRSSGRGGTSSRSTSPARPASPRTSAQQQQQMPAPAMAAGTAASSMDSSDIAAREPADLLSRLTDLLQAASLGLLPSAGPSELAILFYSQVVTSTSLQAMGHTGLSIPRPWIDAWLAATQGSFGSASSRDLAQWVWCLAQRGVRPPGQWLAGFQVASFRQMSKANSQDLASMLWALGSLGLSPDPAWLQQHLQEASRCQYQKQLTPQHMANIAWALAKLGHRPDRDWMVQFQEDVFTALPAFKAQELTNVLWALAVLNCKAEQDLLDECLASMADRLSSFKANEVAISLWAVARLRGQPHPQFMAAALQHCFSQARQLSPKGLSMLMWSVGNSATPPPKAWVAKLLVATQVRMPGFSAQELSMLAVSLARLEYRPPDAWLDCFAAAAAAQMDKFEAQALSNTLWALATLHYSPSEQWMTCFDSQLQCQLAAFTPAHVAMTVWAMSSLEWLPQQPLWQQLQERAQQHSASFCLRSQRMLSRAIRVLEKVEGDSSDYD